MKLINTSVFVSLKTVERQLLSLGEFTLLSLCDEAKHRGIKRLSSVVRLGDFREELQAYLVESHADVLVASVLPFDTPGVTVAPEEFKAYLVHLAGSLSIEVLPVDLTGK